MQKDTEVAEVQKGRPATGLRLKQNAKLHNKFRFVLTDAETGEVKQEAYAYNILCAGMYSELRKIIEYTSSGYPQMFGIQAATSVIKGMVLGTGTGTLDESRTVLFNELDAKDFDNVSFKDVYFHDSGCDVAAGTAYCTFYMTWTELEIQNSSITEVGLRSHAVGFTLASHALIEDAEGNPISIEKGTTDVLTVYSTIYMELSQAYGTNLTWCQYSDPLPVEGDSSGAGNWLLDLVYRGAAWRYGATLQAVVGSNNTAPTITDHAVLTEVLEKDLVQNWTDDKNLGLSVRFATAEANIHGGAGLWEVGVHGRHWPASAFFGTTSNLYGIPFFRSVVPLTGVWDGFTVTGEEIGEGDGIETVFTTQWSPIKSGTLAVYVDSVLQTEGAEADYTVDLATGAITFDTAPANGLAVTADYDIDQIPKDTDHVLDVEFTLQFADGNV